MNIELVVWGHIRYNDKIVGGYHDISMQMCVMSTAHLTMLTYWRERDIFLKVSACELLGRIIHLQIQRSRIYFIHKHAMSWNLMTNMPRSNFVLKVMEWMMKFRILIITQSTPHPHVACTRGTPTHINEVLLKRWPYSENSMTGDLDIISEREGAGTPILGECYLQCDGAPIASYAFCTIKLNLKGFAMREN